MKTNTNRLFAALLAIGLAFLITQSVQANPERFERKVTKITEKLNLNSTQQVLLRTYLTERQTLKQQRKANRDNSSNDFAILSNDSFLTIEQVNSMMDSHFAKRKAERQASIAAFVNFRNSLSAEQRQQGAKTLKRLFKMKGKSKHKGKKDKAYKKQKVQ